MTEGHTSEKPGCFLLPRLLRNDRPALSFERCRSRKRERLMPGSHPSEQALSDQHRQAPAVCGNWLAISYDLPTQLVHNDVSNSAPLPGRGRNFSWRLGPFFSQSFFYSAGMEKDTEASSNSLSQRSSFEIGL